MMTLCSPEVAPFEPTLQMVIVSKELDECWQVLPSFESGVNEEMVSIEGATLNAAFSWIA